MKKSRWHLMKMEPPKDKTFLGVVDGVVRIVKTHKPVCYKGFARRMLTEVIESGCDLDGGHLQVLSENFGIIKEVSYDPMVHGDSEFAEAGDPWFEFVEPEIE